MGLAAVGGQLLGGVLLAANPAGLGWRTVFLINLPIGARRAGADTGARADPVRPTERPHRHRRHGTGDRRRHRDRAPSGRGPGARLAAVDMAVTRRGAAAGGDVRRAAAPAGCRGRRPARGAGAVRPRGRSRPDSPASSCSGAGRRRSSWCWRCISRRDEGLSAAPRARVHDRGRSRTWRPRCAHRR